MADEVVIPFRIDDKDIYSAFRRIGAAGKKAGDEVKEGTDKAKEGTDSFLTSLLKAETVSRGLNFMRDLSVGMAAALQDAAKHTQELAEKFIALRTQMQAVMALAGKAGTDVEVVEEAKKARAAKLTPQEWAEYKEQFLGKASSYISEEKGAILSPKEADILQAKTAEFAKAKGVKAGEMAGFVGGALVQETGPTTAEDMMAKLGQAWAIAEASSKAPQELVPGLTELMAQGFTLKTAAPTLAMMPEIAPGQEATYVKRTVMEVQQQMREGKISPETGVERGMEPRLMLETLIKYFEKQTAGIEDPKARRKAIEDQVAKITKQDIPIQTLTAMAMKGSQAFEHWAALGEKAGPKVIATKLAEYEDTEAGKLQASLSERATAQIISGAETAPLERLKIEAEARLEEHKVFQDPSKMFFRGFQGGIPGMPGAKDAKQELILEEALQMSRERAGLPRLSSTSFLQWQSELRTNQQIQHNMEMAERKKQTKNLETQTQIMEGDAKPPLASPPAAVPNLRMGS